MFHIRGVSLTLSITGPLGATRVQVFTLTLLTLAHFTGLQTMDFHVLWIGLTLTITGPERAASNLVITVALVWSLMLLGWRLSDTKSVVHCLAFKARGRTTLIVRLLSVPISLGGVEADNVPGVLCSSGQIATFGTVAADLVCSPPHHLEEINQKTKCSINK